MSSEAIEKAMLSGVALGRFADRWKVSIVYPENIRGLVRRDALEVPHSEAAMHMRAAGGNLLAWAVHRQHSAAIVFQRGAHVGFAQGTPRELLSHELQRLMEGEKAWSHGVGDFRRRSRR